MPDVRLLVTPFLPREQPALGVSSMSAVLQSKNYSSDVAYYNLKFLDRFPEPYYDFVANFPPPHLLGEMLFSRALWKDGASRWSDYLSALKQVRSVRRSRAAATVSLFSSLEQEQEFWKHALGAFEALYDEAPLIVDKWADEICADPPRILGFSTTFQQNVPSLALAQAVRRRVGRERTAIVFGGSNCEGEMGRALSRGFDFIDYVLSGEGEISFASLVAELLDRRAPLKMFQENGRRFVQGESVHELDLLPEPDFDDYFRTVSQMERRWPLQLAAETSRGCWWGAKSHCKFCGLNGSTMAYRSKTPARAVKELTGLAERYGVRRFMMADNILDTRYFASMLPALENQQLELFYEVKSNLRKGQVHQMRAAGVTWIQPGIESLSSKILALMGKGCSAAQNVQLLRWCREIGIKPSWNILYGFPGEDPEDYRSAARQACDFCHLHPPSAVLPFRLDRFSPYFVRAAEEGLRAVKPSWAYKFAYPALSDADQFDIAYFFEFEFQDGRAPHLYVQELMKQVCIWDEAFRRGASLSLIDTAGGALVHDSRQATPITTRLTSRETELLDLLDEAHSIQAVFRTQRQRDVAAEETTAMLECFRQRRWIFEESGSVVRLPVRYEAMARREVKWQ